MRQDMQVAIIEGIDLTHYFNQPTMPDGTPAFSTPEERGEYLIAKMFQDMARFYDNELACFEERIQSPVFALTVLRKHGIPMKACVALAKKIGQIRIDKLKTGDNHPSHPLPVVE